MSEPEGDAPVPAGANGSAGANGPARPVLSVGYPPGLSPDKWLRRMAERFPDVDVRSYVLDLAEARVAGASRLLGSPAGMTSGTAASPAAADAASGGPGGADEPESGDGESRPTRFDVVFVRESVADPRSAPPGLARIPLYEEAESVLVPKDHEASLFASLSLAELAGERWVDPVDPLVSSSADVRAHVELVAANVGLGRLPLPLARAHSRRDVIVIPLDEPPRTRVGVAWLPARGEEEAIAGFVGIVQGRTANTSRGPEASGARGAAAEETGARTGGGRGTARNSGGAQRGGSGQGSGSGSGRASGRDSGRFSGRASGRDSGRVSGRSSGGGSGRGRSPSGARGGRKNGRGGRR